MKQVSGETIGTTESVCPECLSRVPALRVRRENEVFLDKTCPEHGHFQTVIWRGQPDFTSWKRSKTPAYPKNAFTTIERGCPFDCGLCPEHRQHTCHALLEVTQRCNLLCPVCYADSGNPNHEDPSLAAISEWFQLILKAGGPYNVQLSGGEPTLRHDLPEIIALGRSLGFSYIQLNTNGLRLAYDLQFVDELKQAGLSTVFLQFDGTSDDIYLQLRGTASLEFKQKAIENCSRLGLGVILVPTLVPGVNDQDIGPIVQFALRHAPIVRGVHFQPVSYFGRYASSPSNESRLTIPEIIRALIEQTSGLVQEESFRPPGCENSWCSFHANYVILPDNRLLPVTQHKTASACCQPEDGAHGAALARKFVANQWVAPDPDLLLPVFSGPGLGEWEVVLQRAHTHSFCISGMAFQDAWNLDLERLRDCCIHVMSPDGKLIPFCAYNLTSSSGQTLYRNATTVRNPPVLK